MSTSHESLQAWQRKELWTLWEAAYLLCDRQPPLSELDFLAERDSASAVGVMYRALKDATHKGSLEFIRADARDTLMRRRIEPSSAIGWARDRAKASALELPAWLRQSSMAMKETIEQRRTRRQDRFHQLGGAVVPHGTGWRMSGKRGALAALVDEEKAAGRTQSDRADVRRDLIAAHSSRLGVKLER